VAKSGRDDAAHRDALYFGAAYVDFLVMDERVVTPGTVNLPVRSIQAAVEMDGEVSSQTLNVYVAASVYRRSQGLRYRQTLRKAQGMLFVYPEDVQVAFTMQDTHLPLTIFWFDAEGSLVGSAALSPRDPSPVHCPKPFRYALELTDPQISVRSLDLALS